MLPGRVAPVLIALSGAISYTTKEYFFLSSLCKTSGINGKIGGLE
ncbi:hypothetical protein SACIG1150_0670 [Staphylococcus aureus subsp. aureus CIG1150]|nr:hypothetical protein SACIG1150_0670 [Staphylococcus aureus subsp. aureus CIG1150]